MGDRKLGTQKELNDFDKAVQRLRSHPDFKIIVSGLERRLEVYKIALMNKSGEELSRLQGSAIELHQLIGELTKTPKE